MFSIYAVFMSCALLMNSALDTSSASLKSTMVEVAASFILWINVFASSIWFAIVVSIIFASSIRYVTVGSTVFNWASINSASLILLCTCATQAVVISSICVTLKFAMYHTTHCQRSHCYICCHDGRSYCFNRINAIVQDASFSRRRWTGFMIWYIILPKMPLTPLLV